MVINGDGRDLPLLIEEGIKNTQAFVALTANAETKHPGMPNGEGAWA